MSESETGVMAGDFGVQRFDSIELKLSISNVTSALLLGRRKILVWKVK